MYFCSFFRTILNAVQGNGRGFKFLLLGSLYFTQMMPLAFFFSSLPVILRKDGFSLQNLAYLGFLGIPHMIKFIWAPYIDRGAGKKNHYKKIVVSMTICYAIVSVIASQLDPVQHTLGLCLLLMIGLAFLSTQDIAVDAIATKILSQDEIGVGNGIQAAGAFFGYFMGGGVLLLLYNTVGGWSTSVMILSGLLVLGLIPLFFLKEPTAPVKSKAGIKDVFSFFKNKRILPLLSVAVISGLFLEVAYHKIRPLLTDAGFSIERIGLFLSIIGMLSGIVTSILFGYLVKKWGFKKTFLLSVSVVLLAFPAFMLLAQGNLSDGYVAAVAILGGACSGALHATVYAFFMTNARAGKEGSDFTLQNAFSFLLNKLIVAPLFGRIGDTQGYLTLFIVAAILHVAVVIISFIVVRKRNHDTDGNIGEAMKAHVGEFAESEGVSSV